MQLKEQSDPYCKCSGKRLKDQRQWLRSGYHEALGFEPDYVMFEIRMVTNASAYSNMRCFVGIATADLAQ